MNEASNEQRSFIGKAIQHLKDFIKGIKRLLRIYGSTDKAVRAAVETPVEQLEFIAQRFEIALQKAAKNKKPATDEGGVKYSHNTKKIYQGMTEKERAVIIKNTVIKVVHYDGDNKLIGKAVLKLKSSYNSKAGKILKFLGEKFDVFKKYSNENISLEFNYSRGSLNESVHKQGDISTNFYDFAKMLYVFDDVVKNAVSIEVHTDKYAGTKRENPNLKHDYVLLSAFCDGEYITPVEFHIKEYFDNKKTGNKLYISITLGKIKIENKVKVHRLNVLDEHQGENTRLFSEISVPQLFSKINPEYGNFYKYIPDELLDVEQIKSKYMAQKNEEYRLKVMRGEDVRDILENKAKE